LSPMVSSISEPAAFESPSPYVIPNYQQPPSSAEKSKEKTPVKQRSARKNRDLDDSDDSDFDIDEDAYSMGIPMDDRRSSTVPEV